LRTKKSRKVRRMSLAVIMDSKCTRTDGTASLWF
jgi:hypothetical protein